MIDFRPFRNDDPPAICKIWRSHPPTRGIYGEITPTLLESVVLSRPFFDRDGLIIATENDRPLGFAHAGFAVNTDGSGLDLHRGTTCMLMVEGLSQRMDVAGQLVQQCEGYLRRRGAQQLYAGATPLLAPFYVGLYGGAVAPGLLASDATVLDVFQRAGYVPSAQRRILQRSLAGFRPPIDRQQVFLKRTMRVEQQPDPPSNTWWEACTEGVNDRFCFAALPCAGGSAIGSVRYWDMEPLSQWLGRSCPRTLAHGS